MPIKFITTDEFDSLQLSNKFSPRITEACRHIFVNKAKFNDAATMCGLIHKKETEDLFAALQIINQYLKK